MKSEVAETVLCGSNSAKPQSVNTVYGKIPKLLWLLFVLGAVYSLGTANAMLTASGVLLLPIVISLLWRQNEPPILLFICLVHWLQITTTVFYANWFRVSLNDAWGGPELTKAIAFSLVGLAALAVGMRVALRGGGNQFFGDQARAEAIKMSVSKLFAGYLASLMLMVGSKGIAQVVPSLSQAILVLSSFKWFFYFLLAFAIIQRKRGLSLLVVVTLIEVVIGLSGFFSGFKNVFFILLVVLTITKFRLTIGRSIALVGVFLIVLLFSIVWSSIKVEYREFLNQGTGEQVALVPVSERFAKLAELVGSLNQEGIMEGSEALIRRICYVEYFAHTIRNVPASIPHENGRLWLEAVEHVLKPRLFFPNKAAINDSDRTSLYSGVEVAGADQGTSISIGYMGESYIDFGPIGMVVPIFLLGSLYGFIYRYFIFHARYKSFGFALAGTILIFGAYNLESSNLKLLGGIVISFLVLALTEKLVLSQLAATLGLTNGEPVRHKG